jgi:hypothetical protein
VFAEKVGVLIPAELKPAREPLVRSIHSLSEHIRRYDERVERLANKKYPETRLLRQAKGVGPLIALIYVLTIEQKTGGAVASSVGDRRSIRTAA